MLDLTILRAMKHRDRFDKVYGALPLDNFEKQTQILLQDFARFFKETDYPVIKVGPFKSLFFNFYHPQLSEERKSAFNLMLDRLEKDNDPTTDRQINNHLVELSFATDVANDCRKYADGDDIDVIATVGARHEYASDALARDNAKSIIVDDDISEQLVEITATGSFTYSLSALRSNLRQPVAGDFIIIAGRPDIGKTSLVLSTVIPWAGQHSRVDAAGEDTKSPILWFNNEGQGNRIVKRAYQCALGDTTDDLRERAEADTLKSDYHDALNGGTFSVVNCHDWTSAEVEDVIDSLRPSVVVFDMIDNIEFKGLLGGSKDARTDQVLEQMYQWARKLGVKYDCVVIACSQVSAEAERENDTQMWPAMHMLKDSKTGKQGAADLIMMIGQNPEPGYENQRYISTPKNKLGLDTGGTTRYVKTIVNIDTNRCRFRDPGRA